MYLNLLLLYLIVNIRNAGVIMQKNIQISEKLNKVLQQLSAISVFDKNFKRSEKNTSVSTNKNGYKNK